MIDLLRLNGYVMFRKFKMEMISSMLLPFRKGDFMFSIDLEDAYLQILNHPGSTPGRGSYLRQVSLH